MIRAAVIAAAFGSGLSATPEVKTNINPAWAANVNKTVCLCNRASSKKLPGEGCKNWARMTNARLMEAIKMIAAQFLRMIAHSAIARSFLRVRLLYRTPAAALSRELEVGFAAVQEPEPRGGLDVGVSYLLCAFSVRFSKRLSKSNATSSIWRRAGDGVKLLRLPFSNTRGRLIRLAFIECRRPLRRVVVIPLFLRLRSL